MQYGFMQLLMMQVLLSLDRRTGPLKVGVKAFTVSGSRFICVISLLFLMILIFMKSLSDVLKRNIPIGIALGVMELSSSELEFTNLRGSLLVRLSVVRRSSLTKFDMKVRML